jgi:hypothetical protein
VPALRDAFADALARVDKEIELADTALRFDNWANDPVSTKATKAFNNRSLDDASSALDSLRAYRTQLSTAIETLEKTDEQYRASEEDSSVNVGKQEGTGQG